MLVVNASRIKIDYKTLSFRITSGTLTDRSMEFLKIDLQGPSSKQLLQPYFKDINLDEMGFFSFIQTELFGEYCLLSRTGYTGEMGFELYVNENCGKKIWDALLKDGANACGLGARDALRLEMGYSLYGNDLDENISPLEANVGMFVGLKRNFIGRDALVKQKESGLKRLLIPFKTSSRRSARAHFKVFQNDKEIGFVTSGAFSPILGVGIGLAMIDIASFDEDKAFELKDERSSIEANKASLPFIKK
jgi:aminomethyltransferase